MEKMKKILKEIYIIVIVIFITTCAFGGGCVYYVAFCLIFNLGSINPIICVISVFAPMPFCFWYAPKFSEKYF